MTLLDRYLFRRLVSVLVKAILGLTLLFIVVDLLTNRNMDIARNNVPLDIVASYYLAYTPWIIGRLAPFAMLVTGLMVLGDAAQNNEITALLAGGVGLRRIAVAPLVVGALFAGSFFALDETVGPTAARYTQAIEEGYFSRSADNDRSGISWANLDEEWTCHIRTFNRIALTGEDVLLLTASAEEPRIMMARRIFWEPERNVWLLEDGFWSQYQPGFDQRVWGRITQQPAPFSEPPEALLGVFEPPETKSAGELMEDILRAEKRELRIDPIRTEYHAKFARPVIIFVMVLLAIPFAIRLRRGGVAISFGLSLLIGAAYIGLFGFTMQLGAAERLEPALAAWLPNAVFGATGLVLFFRTPS